jgi:hypothetical protein
MLETSCASPPLLSHVAPASSFAPSIQILSRPTTCPSLTASHCAKFHRGGGSLLPSESEVMLRNTIERKT